MVESPLATALRWALFGVVVILGVLFFALTAIVAVLGAAIVAMKILTIASIPLLAAIAPIVIVLSLMAAALAGVVVLFQDFWTQIEGGKSAFDWNDNLLFTVKNVEINVTVSGGKDPKTTGRDIGRGIDQSLRDTARQMPIPAP